jgi:hypothetical protein
MDYFYTSIEDLYDALQVINFNSLNMQIYHIIYHDMSSFSIKKYF